MLKFIDSFKIYSEEELTFENIEDAKFFFEPDDEDLKDEAEKISECKDAFDLCEVLNEQESDSRWSYEEE